MSIIGNDPKEIALRNGDVVCWKHGYQPSADNTCEPCYVERCESDGPVLMDKLIEAVETVGNWRNWGDE